MTKEHVYLVVAIVFGLTGQVMLTYSMGFSIVIYTVLSLCSYFLAFTFLALAVKKLPLSISYAIWGGVGTGMSVLIGYLLFEEPLSFLKIIAVLLIITGIIMTQLNGRKEKS